MIDPMGALINELRDHAGVHAIVGDRVRAREPHGKTPSYEGDARGAGHYVPFIVLVTLDRSPDNRVPVTWAEYAVRCYGVDSVAADQLFNAVVDALHRQGPRLVSGGGGVYRSYVRGGVQDVDPATKQPVVTGTIQLIATTQAVT